MAPIKSIQNIHATSLNKNACMETFKRG